MTTITIQKDIKLPNYTFKDNIEAGRALLQFSAKKPKRSSQPPVIRDEIDEMFYNGDNVDGRAFLKALIKHKSKKHE